MFGKRAVGIGCFLSLFLLVSLVCIQRTSATPNPSSAFIVSPSSELVSVNDNFTITVNITNAQDLFSWQVVLKYNGTGLRLNDLWVPEDNVFAGHIIVVPGSRTTFYTDAVDGSSSGQIGATLFDNDFVNVSNGVVCMANFAVLKAGQWTIDVATTSNPLHILDDAQFPWFSFWQTTTLAEEDPLGSNCTIFAVNETVNTGKIGTTTPLDSTSFLSLENFTVSSIPIVSSLSFDPSISELSFQVNVSAADVYTCQLGTEVNITVPASIYENASLVCTLNVDGKCNPYIFFAPSTLGLFLYDEGSHAVTLNIGLIDPLSTIPEFSLPTILLLLVMLALFVVIVRRRIFKTSPSVILLRTYALMC